jgi:regulator of protease activity HflC (stomatin/prohibitin superfamily)
MKPTSTLVLSALGLAIAVFASRVRTRVVRDFEVGLLIRDGCVVRALPPGVYRLFRKRTELAVYDTRPRAIAIPAQETSTADGVPVKATLVLTVRALDAAAIRAASQNPDADLYRAGQVAVRNAVAALELAELVGRNGRAAAAARARASAATAVGRLGYEVVDVELLDVILRGELKRALGEAVAARAEAKARLERARGETAALRSLANAARVLKEHEGLYELRLLETASAAAAAGGSTLVLGLREGLELKNGRA